MARLSESEKYEIVRLLAHYASPSQVVAEMRNLYGVDTDRFQVRAYDPTSPKFEAGERWRAVFEKERSAYEQSINDIPIAHKAFRLNELQKNYFIVQQSGNIRLACDILAQAAKEAGIRVLPGGQIATDVDANDFRHLSSEERKARVVQMINDALHGPADGGRTERVKLSVACG